MYYQTQVIYGDKANDQLFSLDGYSYYKTKKGITKKCKLYSSLKESVKITKDEYETAWKACYELLYAR